MIGLALIITTLIDIISGAPVQNDFMNHANSSTGFHRLVGCCYNGTLISPGKTFCADKKTAIQCVKSSFFWFPDLQMVENMDYDCTDGYDTMTSHIRCSYVTHCLYKGKLAKLGSVIMKEINANDYKIVMCLRNGDVRTMSGMCTDKATSKNNDLCKNLGALVKTIIRLSLVKAPPMAAPAEDALSDETVGEVAKADEDMDQVTGEFEHFGVDNPRKFEEDKEI